MPISLGISWKFQDVPTSAALTGINVRHPDTPRASWSATRFSGTLQPICASINVQSRLPLPGQPAICRAPLGIGEPLLADNRPMHVHQLSISYLPEHDRILVRVNTSESKELQFWVTRRLALGLMPAMQRIQTEHAARLGGSSTAHMVAADPIAKKAIADFQRSETLRAADFSTPYKAPPENEPLFGSPLLVTEINIAPLDGERLRLNCTEKLPQNPQQRTFELALSSTLAHAFMHLLEQAVTKSLWRAVPQAAAEPLALPTHEAKQGYLN